jgi:hypothetical protein
VNIQRTLSTIFYFTKMMFSFPGILASYYSRRRKAVSLFRKELIESGIPPSEARELANLYPFKLSEMVDIARQFSRN